MTCYRLIKLSIIILIVVARVACAAAIFQVLAQVSFGSLLSDIVIANDWLILIHFLSVCLPVCLSWQWSKRNACHDPSSEQSWIESHCSSCLAGARAEPSSYGTRDRWGNRGSPVPTVPQSTQSLPQNVSVWAGRSTGTGSPQTPHGICRGCKIHLLVRDQRGEELCTIGFFYTVLECDSTNSPSSVTELPSWKTTK